MSKVYQFTWLATDGKKRARVGRIAVLDYCYSSAQANAKHRVEAEWNLHGYRIDVSLERVEEKR